MSGFTQVSVPDVKNVCKIFSYAHGEETRCSFLASNMKIHVEEIIKELHISGTDEKLTAFINNIRINLQLKDTIDVNGTEIMHKRNFVMGTTCGEYFYKMANSISILLNILFDGNNKQPFDIEKEPQLEIDMRQTLRAENTRFYMDNVMHTYTTRIKAYREKIRKIVSKTDLDMFTRIESLISPLDNTNHYVDTGELVDIREVLSIIESTINLINEQKQIDVHEKDILIDHLEKIFDTYKMTYEWILTVSSGAQNNQQVDGGLWHLQNFEAPKKTRIINDRKYTWKIDSEDGLFIYVLYLDGVKKTKKEARLCNIKEYFGILDPYFGILDDYDYNGNDMFNFKKRFWENFKENILKCETTLAEVTIFQILISDYSVIYDSGCRAYDKKRKKGEGEGEGKVTRRTLTQETEDTTKCTISGGKNRNRYTNISKNKLTKRNKNKKKKNIKNKKTKKKKKKNKKKNKKNKKTRKKNKKINI